MSVGRQLAVGGLMLTLAAIDFGAALVAKDFADRRRLPALLVGCGLQIALFLVYAVALRIAELSIVTMGWIVLLQVALIGTDVTRNGLRLSAPQWSAVGLVVVLQVYLVATTDGQTRTSTTYETVHPDGNAWRSPVGTAPYDAAIRYASHR
jgi:drug/metabolite transporter (DMT)-like permease